MISLKKLLIKVGVGLFSLLIIFGTANINVNAQGASGINLLPGFDCLIPTSSCTEDRALSSAIVDFLFGLAPVLATLVLIWGGYLYFFGGFDQKLNGRRAITSAIIGYALILLAWGTTGDGNGIILGFVEETLGGSTGSQINADPTRNILIAVRNFLSGIAAIVAVLVIIWGGYKFFFSSLPGAKEDGKQTIANGVIGLVVILVAVPLVGIVSDTFTQQSDQLQLDTTSIIRTFVEIINNFLIPVSAVVTVFFLVWAGYEYIFSQGDPSKVQSARNKFYNALVGFIVVLLAVTISQLIVFFVGNLDLGGSSAIALQFLA